MIKRLKSKSGMTLVEVLTAMTILTLLVFCFAPLFLTYFDGVNRAGIKASETYKEAGLMHSILGNKSQGGATGYISNVSDVPLTLTAPGATVERDGTTKFVDGVNLVVKDAAGNGDLDPIKGEFISSDPQDPKNGFTTITTSLNASIKCFPSTITDDFVKARVMLVADGFNFASSNFSSDIYKLSCTVADGNGGTTLKKLTFGKDYTLERAKNSNGGATNYNILIMTLFGGTDVCFENSPLVFNYNHGAFIKEIEIDAPQMIMVGEQASDGKYYYYVSRGEVDKDGNKIVLRREMKSKDPKNNNAEVKLDSAMNDVEWVPAESGDGNNVYKNKETNKDEKYGYYVMCGDNGQLRRFWKNPATGNYYWGGDYTYDTDISFNRVANQNHFTATERYSTDVAYKFLTRRNYMGVGFNMGAHDGNKLQSANVWTVTAFGNAEGGNQTFFYASDGKIYGFRTKTAVPTPLHEVAKDVAAKGNVLGVPVEAADWIVRKTGYDGEKSMDGGADNESLTWLQADADNEKAYYTLNGKDKATTNPITLTCVDAIVINGYVPNAGEDGYYENAAEASYDFSETGTAPNISYPQKTYTLYCGYIPAAMDAWSSKSGYPTGVVPTLAYYDRYSPSGTQYDMTSTSNMHRAPGAGTLEVTAQYPRWKGNFGVTPYLTRAEDILGSKWELEVASIGKNAYYRDHKGNSLGIYRWDFRHEYINFYPYQNLDYAVTGKFYDGNTDITGLFADDKIVSASLMPNKTYNTIYDRQRHMTNGKVVDITMSYLSHPLATHIAANPTDDMSYNMSNKTDYKDAKNGRTKMYWNNRRETATFLDCASTMVPYGDKDIPVSLMVGYTMGGIVEYSGDDLYVNTVMNNGLVYIRAGQANISNDHSSWYSETGEYYAKDRTGYKLDQESNVFHQFYYLNSRTPYSYGKEPVLATYIGNVQTTPGSIGDIYGAQYWENNRHIQYLSLNGGQPDDPNYKFDDKPDAEKNYNYIRCHPLTNTKVTCVAWGKTWNNNPEAMWGTENGTLLSWWVDLVKAKTEKSDLWNDQSVSAEFQSYKWIENVRGKTFSVWSGYFSHTVGAHSGSENSYSGVEFAPSVDAYNEFFDRQSRALDSNMHTGNYYRSNIGLISVLETVNDVAYDNDMWVAVGDQSRKNPVDYCGTGVAEFAGKQYRAFTGNGRGGSWVNVRYWIDKDGSGVHKTGTNDCYLWKTVQISEKDNYNIVQINNMNGTWYATGYVDANYNGDWDSGEKAVVCWATDPTAPCGTKGGWSDASTFLAYENGEYINVSDEVGGINSVATRS